MQTQTRKKFNKQLFTVYKLEKNCNKNIKYKQGI